MRDDLDNSIETAYAKDMLLLLPELLPTAVGMALCRMNNTQATGQILLNFNQGTIQSFEVKTHTRL